MRNYKLEMRNEKAKVIVSWYLLSFLYYYDMFLTQKTK